MEEKYTEYKSKKEQSKSEATSIASNYDSASEDGGGSSHQPSLQQSNNNDTVTSSCSSSGESNNKRNSSGGTEYTSFRNLFPHSLSENSFGLNNQKEAEVKQNQHQSALSQDLMNSSFEIEKLLEEKSAQAEAMNDALFR